MVLLFADLFHPLDDLAIQVFLNREVSNGSGWRGAVPVLLLRGKPDYVARPDLFNGTALTLGPSATCRHDESLAERMSVPSSAGTGLESNASALYSRGAGCVE